MVPIHRVHEEHCVCALEVGLGQRAVPFLSGSVEDVEADGELIDLVGLSDKVNTDGGLGLRGEFVVDELADEAGLADV